MLAYFPPIYPDELLYSVLARWLRHQGAVGMTNPLKQVFGRRFANATLDLPGWIGHLAASLPDERCLDVNALIEQLTLFPYYAAYVPAPMRSACRHAMGAGSVSGWHMRLGLNAFRVGRIRRLRFCSLCAKEMRLRYGEMYWRRCHQLPGVLLCPDHGCPLQYSAFNLGDRGRYDYVAASEVTCSSNLPRIQLPGGNGRARLWETARRSAGLLVNPVDPRDFETWTAHYRMRMARSGLAWSAKRMKVADLIALFEEHYGEVIPCLASECDGISAYREWLPGMVRKHRKVAHPLQHIMLEALLDSRTHYAEPFGAGPWPCCNPLAPHAGSLSVDTVTRHRNRGHDVGVFVCSCGYVYTRRFIESSGILEPPRVQQFGPLLDVELRRLVDSGSKLRPAARALRVDPKTVARRAHELDLPVTWKHPPRRSAANTASAGTKKSATHSSIPTARAKPVPRKHWAEIDELLAEKIHREAELIRNIEPPRRVGRTELERRVRSRDWISKRLNKLPKSGVALLAEVEDRVAFHDRRLRWAVQVVAGGSMSVSLARLANRVGVTAASLRSSLLKFTAGASS